jgi:hypothetical protein
MEEGRTPMETGKPKGDDMSALPVGLKGRVRIVSVDDPRSTSEPPGKIGISVERWNVAKLLAINDFLAESYSSMSEDDVKTIGGKDVKATVAVFMKFLGSKVVDVVRLSVIESERGIVSELAADDFLAVLEAVVEMNLTEKFLGKIKSLAVAFVERTKASGIRSNPQSG